MRSYDIAKLIKVSVCASALAVSMIGIPALAADSAGAVALERSAHIARAASPAARQLTNPLGKGTTIQTLIGRAINIFTGVSGSVALLMFVYGGFLWLTSGGSTDKIAKGKKVFTWSAVGLLIIFGSYAILRALFQALGVGL